MLGRSCSKMSDVFEFTDSPDTVGLLYGTV